MAIFLPALVVLGGAAAALFASCTPSKDPEDENPESDDPSATPPPSNTSPEEGRTPTITIDLSPTSSSTDGSTDTETPTPPDSYTEDREFLLMLHIIRSGTCQGGIANSTRDDLVDQVREFLASQTTAVSIPEELFEEEYVAVDEVCNDELYNNELDGDYNEDGGTNFNDHKAQYNDAMGEGAFQEDYPDDRRILHITTGSLFYPGVYSIPPSTGEGSNTYQIFLDNDSDSMTLPHEMGHWGGLSHTFPDTPYTDPETGEIYGTSELVVRPPDPTANCGTAVDTLCGTPADPADISHDPASCEMLESSLDPQGNPYTPDIKNLMAAYWGCDHHLSSDQNEIIKTTLDKRLKANSTALPPADYPAAPTSFTVNCRKSTDVEAGTALAQIAKGGEIAFCGVTPLASPSAMALRGVTLTSDDSSAPATLDGQGKDAILRLTGSSDLTLRNLTIQNGLSERGAVSLDNWSSLTVEDVTFRDNRSVGDETYWTGSGGAISAVYANRVSIRGNTSFINNSSAGAYGGGAVSISYSKSVELVGSPVASTTISCPVSPLDPNPDAWPSAVEVGYSLVFAGNQAGTGGAVDLFNVASSVMTGASMVCNHAMVGRGGAMSFYDVDDATHRDTEFLNNTALAPYKLGGAISVMDSTLFFETNVSLRNNVAAGAGGAIALFDSSLTLSESILDGNIAQRETGLDLYLQETSYPTTVSTDDESAFTQGTYPNTLVSSNPSCALNLLDGVAYYVSTEFDSCEALQASVQGGETAKPVGRSLSPAPLASLASIDPELLALLRHREAVERRPVPPLPAAACRVLSSPPSPR